MNVVFEDVRLNLRGERDEMPGIVISTHDPQKGGVKMRHHGWLATDIPGLFVPRPRDGNPVRAFAPWARGPNTSRAKTTRQRSLRRRGDVRGPATLEAAIQAFR